MNIGEARHTIKRERPFVDVKPYSHNIISGCLAIVAKKYGKESANALIRELELEELGWKCQEEK